MIGYIIQEPVPPGKNKAYQDKAVPKTAIIWDPNKLRDEFTISQLIRDSLGVSAVEPDEPDPAKVPTYFWAQTIRENEFQPTKHVHNLKKGEAVPIQGEPVWGLQIPPVIIRDWNLWPGDEVEIHVIDNHNPPLIAIAAVNGCRDPEKLRHRLNLGKPDGPQVDYPTRQLPLHKSKSPELRAITLLAPVGCGQLVGGAGCGGTGKSKTLEDVADSTCQVAQKNDRVHVVILFLGDHPEDTADYSRVTNKYRNNRIETYEATWNDSVAVQVRMAFWVMDRVRALASMGNVDVIYVFDGLGRLAEALCDINDPNIMDPNSTTIIKGGMYRAAIRMAIDSLVGTGNYGSTTITGICSMLLPDPTGDFGASEAAFTLAVLKSRFNSVWMFTPAATLYPKLAVKDGATYTRWPERFLSPEEVKLTTAMQCYMWGKFSPTDDDNSYGANAAHRRLVEWSQQWAAGIAPNLTERLITLPYEVLELIDKSSTGKVTNSEVITKALRLLLDLRYRIDHQHKLILLNSDLEETNSIPTGILILKAPSPLLPRQVFIAENALTLLKECPGPEEQEVFLGLRLLQQLKKWGDKQRLYVMDEGYNLKGFYDPETGEFVETRGKKYTSPPPPTESSESSEVDQIQNT